MNTAIALRGVPSDYDEWASLGNPLWSWDKVLPAFIRLENDLDFGDTPIHGGSGPLPIRRHTREELVPYQSDGVRRPTDAELADPALLEPWVWRNSSTGAHPSCTARMGPADEPDGCR